MLKRQNGNNLSNPTPTPTVFAHNVCFSSHFSTNIPALYKHSFSKQGCFFYGSLSALLQTNNMLPLYFSSIISRPFSCIHCTSNGIVELIITPFVRYRCGINLAQMCLMLYLPLFSSQIGRHNENSMFFGFTLWYRRNFTLGRAFLMHFTLHWT